MSVGRIVGEEGEAVEDDGDSNIRGRADGTEEGVTRFCLVGGSEHVNVGDEVEGKELLGGLVRGEGGLIRRGEGRLVRGGEGGTNLLIPSSLNFSSSTLSLMFYLILPFQFMSNCHRHYSLFTSA